MHIKYLRVYGEKRRINVGDNQELIIEDLINYVETFFFYFFLGYGSAYHGGVNGE